MTGPATLGTVVEACFTAGLYFNIKTHEDRTVTLVIRSPKERQPRGAEWAPNELHVRGPVDHVVTVASGWLELMC